MKPSIFIIATLFIVIFSEAQVCPLKTSVKDSIQNRLGKGTPKSSSAIVLRCNSTPIENNNVIYVVDGILLESKKISELNPSDILSIDLLKPSDQIISCRMTGPVIVITTKKQYRREFIVKDEKSLLGVSSASIEARSTKTGKSFFFTADEFGKLETDSLKSIDYMIRVSAVGYKTKEMNLKMIQQYKGEIKLEREFVELKEVVIVAFQKIICRRTYTCTRVTKCSMDDCNIIGFATKKQKEEVPGSSFGDHNSMVVYPNPIAASGTINISFPNVKPGQYQIRMLNAAGQLFYSFQKQISGKGETGQIYLNAKTVPGIYVVQVLDDQKKLLQTSKVVVQ